MPGNRLDRSVDDESDHVLGPADAPITLVEYGSYACPYCRAANERIAEVRDQFGDRMRYIFRHRPLTGVEIARRAAELVERAPDPKRFWEEHIKLMTRSETLTEDDLKAVARDLGVPVDCGPPEDPAVVRAKTRVDADEASAAASGALITPTFFINGRRYDGPGTGARLLMRCWARFATGCARRRSISPAGDRRRVPSCSWRQSSPSQ
jgi:NhaA family Na+:H+ antiporter